jgi:hypothetical protein
MTYFVVKTVKRICLDSVSGDYTYERCWQKIARNFVTPEKASEWAMSKLKDGEEFVVLCDYTVGAKRKNKKQS